MERISKYAAALLLLVFICVGVGDTVKRSNVVLIKDVKLQSKSLQIKQLQIDYEKKADQLDQYQRTGAKDAETIRKLNEQLQQMDEKTKRLEQELSVKREAQRLAKEKTERIAALSSTASAASGTKEQWMEAAGIPQSEWWAVDWIVSRESGWNPCAYYPGKSDCSATPTTACGLVQSYPCSKLGPNWTDPVAALKWQHNYVSTAAKFKPYGGGYVGAVAYWKIHGNY